MRRLLGGALLAGVFVFLAGVQPGGSALAGEAGGAELRQERRGGKGARRGKRPGEGKPDPKRQGGKGAQVNAAWGNMFLQRGSTRAAAAAFRRQLEKDPDSPALNVGLAKALARIGECEEALDHFWPHVGSRPFGAEAALAASTCSSRLGLLDDAVLFDRMAVDMDKDSARALTNLALDLSSAGEHAAAEEILDELLFLRPYRDASTYARAVLALRAGRIEEFDAIAFSWEQIEGPTLDLRRLQAQAWLDLDDPVSALQSLENIRSRKQGQQVRMLRAEALRRSGYASEAARTLEDRPQTVLEGVEIDAVRARVFADLGDFDQARELLAEYPGHQGPEITASAWYLAHREGRAADLPALAEAYGRVQESPLRDLDQLVPWGDR